MIGEVGRINQGTGEKAWITRRGYKIELGKYLGDHVIPVTRQTAKSIQGFIEEPILILVKSWFIHGKVNYSKFIIWKGSLKISFLQSPCLRILFSPTVLTLIRRRDSYPRTGVYHLEL